jgi:FHS family Na+ dependent glucose MFS transporter 1
MISPKRTKRNQTIGYYFAFISLGMATAAFGPALPYLAVNTDVLIGQVSILFSTKAGGYLFGSIVGRRLYDRMPGHLIAVGALLGICASFALSPKLSLLWLLAIVMFGLGMFEGALDVGGNVMLGWIHGSEVGPFMNAPHFFFGIGTFIAPIIIAQSVLITRGIVWGFWTIALLLLPVAAWFLRSNSPSAPAP